MAAEPATVSVCIPAYGPCPTLPDLIDLLRAQSVRPNEIIVVHSGPGDPTAQLAAKDAAVHVEHRDARLLPGAARNIAADRASGAWLAFIDADVVPGCDWLANLLAAAQARPGSYVFGSVGHAQTGGYWGLALWSIEFAGVSPHLPDRAARTIASCNMAVSAPALARVGGFPSRFAAAEDTVLAAKLRAAGLRPWFCAAARVDHVNIPGFRHFARHLARLGRHAALARRALPLRGRVAARIWPLAPFLFLSKFAETSYLALRWGRGRRRQYLFLAPGILLGCLIWNFGLLSGLRAPVPPINRELAVEGMIDVRGSAGAAP